MVTDVPSPCVGICRISTDENGQDICVGCQRSMEEITQWRLMGNQDKLRILDRLGYEVTSTGQLKHRR